MVRNNREKKIFEFVSIIRLITLLIFGIAVFSEYMKSSEEITSEMYLFNINVMIVFLSLLFFTNRIWLGNVYNREVKSKKNVIIQFTEISIALIMFTALVIFAPDVTQYKMLFLLIIIMSVIQYGFRTGMIVSIISSGIILVADIITLPNVIVNEPFQYDLLVVGVFIVTAWLLGYYVKIEKEHREYITHLAIIDGLTEVYNHRHFYDRLKEIIENARKTKSHVSLLFIDIDHFKHYNDLLGHQRGDSVLKDIAAILKANVRSEDLVARYGGEEFAVILQDTVEKDAIVIAERIRKQVENTHFDGEEYQPSGNLTVSIGVSCFPEKAQNDTELVNSADDALYRAKFFNKNRVETYYSILQDLKNDIKEKDINLITSIKTLISVINAKDRYTYGHTERVVMYAQMLGQRLDLSKENLKTLKYGAYLHDIGKIHIPKEILNKKMPFTQDEWDIMKQHPVSGAEIIEPVESLNRAKPLIMHHHERYDGKGYPAGLKGSQIPYLARVICVVDSFDAMTSKRTYKAEKSIDDAISELKKCSGTQFDPDIVDAFIEVISTNQDKFSSLAQNGLPDQFVGESAAAKQTSETDSGPVDE